MVSIAWALSKLRFPLAVALGGSGHDGTIATLASNTNWNTITDPGEYFISGPTGANAPASFNTIVKVQNTSVGIRQEAVTFGSTVTFSRYFASNAWSSWARSVDLSTVVGTVSFVDPGIIERGSNANGEFVKYKDGTLICWRNDTTTVAMTSAYGSIFNGPTFPSVNYPHAFTSMPTVTQTVYGASGVTWLASNGTPSLTQWVGMFPLSAVSQASVTLTINRLAIGRWF